MRCLHSLGGLLHTDGGLGGVPWATLCRLIPGLLELELFLDLLERLLRLKRGLCSRPLFCGQGTRNGFDDAFQPALVSRRCFF
jgi:hypothetical protein